MTSPVLPVEEYVGLCVDYGGRLDLRDVAVIKFIPLLVDGVEGVGRVVTTSSRTVVTNDTRQIVLCLLIEVTRSIPFQVLNDGTATKTWPHQFQMNKAKRFAQTTAIRRHQCSSYFSNFKKITKLFLTVLLC